MQDRTPTVSDSDWQVRPQLNDEDERQRRIATIDHNGKTVLLADFSGMFGAPLMALMEAALERDREYPDGSLLLTDIKDTVVNKDVRMLAVQMGKEADRRRFKQAIVGVYGFQKVLFMAFKRSVYLADNRQDALQWLATRQDD